jgi:hypothetical protein
MFEQKKSPLISRQAFRKRMIVFFLLSMALLVFSLALGCFGYHSIAGLSWIDSLLNASMILAGMGPVNELRSESAKLFASFYSLFSGIAFLSMAAVLFAPILHRFLHKLHLDDSSKNG